MPNWLKRLASRLRQRVSLVSPWLQGVAWNVSRAFLALARDAYGQNSVVYACLQILSQSIPEPPLLAYEVGENLERKLLPFDHPLRRLIRAPNEQMTEYEMMEMIELHLGICGRSNWLKRRDNLGQVVALYPLRPDRIGPIYGKDDADPVLWGWGYIPPGAESVVEIPKSEIMSFLLPDPAGETGGIVEGLGPLQVLAREVETDNEATSFVYALLKNSATPNGLLRVKTPILSRKQLEEIKHRFMAQFGGAKRGEPAVLDADTEYESTGFNLQQLEFPNLRHVSEARIAAAFRVPSILVGLKVGLDAGIRATIQDQRRFFTETTLASRWRRLSDTFTNQLATEFGDNIVLRYDTTQVKALTDQSRFEVQPIKEAFQVGAVTMDEYRIKVLGLPPLDGGQGNFVLIPVGMQAVAVGQDSSALAASINRENNTFAGREEVQDPAADAAKGVWGQPHPHSGGRRKRRAAPPPQRGSGKDRLWYGRSGTGGVPPSQREKRPKRHREATDRRAKRVERRGDGMTNRLSMALSMHALAAQQRVEMGAPLGAAKSWVAGQIVTDAERRRLGGIIRDLWIASLHDAFREASAELGVSLAVNLRDPGVAAHLDAARARVDLLLGPIEAEVLAAVEAANLAAHDRPTLDKALAALDVFSPARVARIARHEAGLAANVADLLAFAAAGHDAVHVIDGDGCAECAGVDGAVWSIDEAMANALGHPNCVRCFYPVREDEDEDDDDEAQAAD